MKKNNELLVWFLNFIELDLEILAPGELAKLRVDLDGFLQLRGIHDLPDHIGKVRDEIVNIVGSGLANNINLVSIQNKLLDTWGFIKARIDSSLDKLNNNWEPLENIDLFPQFGGFNITIRISSSGIPFESKIFKDKTNKIEKFRLDTDKFDTAVFEPVFHGESVEDTALFYFLKSFEEIPLTSIKKCPECQKWYLHTSKRKKVYCSNKCAARKISRDKRAQIKAEDKERHKAELKKGAARARKSYVKKIRSKNPNVKIEQRPRKYK